MGILNDIDCWGLAGQRGGIHQRGQPPPPGIGIDCRESDIGIGDAQQVVEEQQVLRLRVGNPRPYLCTGGWAVQIAHAAGCTQQPRHDMEGNVGWRAIRSRW